jgi:hypothetical protein
VDEIAAPYGRPPSGTRWLRSESKTVTAVTRVNGPSVAVIEADPVGPTERTKPVLDTVIRLVSLEVSAGSSGIGVPEVS